MINSQRFFILSWMRVHGVDSSVLSRKKCITVIKDRPAGLDRGVVGYVWIFVSSGQPVLFSRFFLSGLFLREVAKEKSFLLRKCLSLLTISSNLTT